MSVEFLDQPKGFHTFSIYHRKEQAKKHLIQKDKKRILLKMILEKKLRKKEFKSSGGYD
ncbi:hypothetical protein [Bacillus salacetis]|uniref:hypothetical protein n=1 Tax=Bacillus salacetis TaxID=2315464 RepID=UPI0014442FF3|nr:hypothetical protein [Bacillus salacetis]